jgi:hypothetical protein
MSNLKKILTVEGIIGLFLGFLAGYKITFRLIDILTKLNLIGKLVYF